MAYMRKGFMGGFTGRLGDKIGYIVNGVQYVRSAPKKRMGPGTAEQIIQREKFSLMTKFMSPVAPFMNEVHKNKNCGKYYSNKLFSTNHREAVMGKYPEIAIDYRRFQLTAGTLPCPAMMNISCDQDAFLNFHWDDESNRLSTAHPLDRLWLAFYDGDRKCWEIQTNSALRGDIFISVDMKNHRGNQVHVYAGFISVDKRKVSNSPYLGEIKIL
jgi:hypothetical protein